LLPVGSCLAESHRFVCVLIDETILLDLTVAINSIWSNVLFRNEKLSAV
jgi:hypothetical protein